MSRTPCPLTALPLRRARRAYVLWMIAIGAISHQATAQSLQDLSALSLEELANVEITSVSKRPEPLSQAPAAIYVITGDEIRRSGAATLPEALRLAPNLEVARVDSQTYSISSRGLNSVNASNKLLVLIDGRSIYTPFFSSVFWDQQEVMLADVDRIEVISGPGGTLWGANAMNGVINIITKSSADTQGGLVDVAAGDFLQNVAGRWGGKLGDSGTFRGYALGFGQGHTRLPDGSSGMDDWHGKQAGFRGDVAALGSTFTLQGDAYENVVDTPGGRRDGGDIVGRWTRQISDASSVQVQMYYDNQKRSDLAAAGGGSSDRLETFDIEAQQLLALGDHQVVWGLGQRVWKDQFINTANVAVLVPESETLSLTSLFAQDTMILRPDLKLTYGAKLEHSTFSGWNIMPNVRLGWDLSRSDFLWAAISRAIRSPSRIERDLAAPGIVDTSPDFQSERLVAYEAGWRSQLLAVGSLSLSLFYNDYDDLRTTSPAPVTIFPVSFGNGWKGHTYGTDFWASYSPVRWWRLGPGFEILRKDFHLKPGEADIAGVQSVLGHDPGHQIFLRSYMDMPHDTELYIGLREIAKLPDVNVGSYLAADVKVGWHVTRRLELSLTGSNVTRAYHAETSAPPTSEIPRSVLFGVRWSY